jgi:tetrahydromethanopterin S-methyltransferase subunit E
MITDVALTELGKALNGESFTVPLYIAVGDTVMTALSSDTSLPGEYRRTIATKVRAGNSVNHNVLITGAAITSSTGKYIYGAGMLSASSGGNLFTDVSVPGLLQTTAFDIEIDWGLTVNRQ